MGQVVYSRCFAVNKNGGCLLLRARVYCVKFGIFTFTFHFAGMAQVNFQPSRDMTWHTLIKQRYDVHHRTVAISAGAKRSQKSSEVFRTSPFAVRKTPFLVLREKGDGGSKRRGRQSTSVGILEYSSRNTRVLLWQYSSTAPKVLEYCRESTAVLSLKY